MSSFGVASPEQDLDRLTSLFRLLSDRTRLNILLALSQGERNVSSLCDELHLPQPTVSHHLGLLRVNSLIANRRRGKQVFYSLNGAVQLGQDPAVQLSMDNYQVKILKTTA